VKAEVRRWVQTLIPCFFATAIEEGSQLDIPSVPRAQIKPCYRRPIEINE
jgi:hypothetical protein